MKDSYYFKHDSNAKDDPKCVMLIEQLGLEGYGIFWVLIEILRDQPGYCCPLSLIKPIARRYLTTEEKVKTVILNYGLFSVNDESFFYSESLLKRMNDWDSKRVALSEAGRKGNNKRWHNLNGNNQKAIAMQSGGDRVAIANREEKIREEKIREEKSIVENKSISQIEIFLKENKIFSSETFEFLNSEHFFELKCMQLVTDYASLFEKAKEFLIDVRDRDMIEGKSLEDMRSHFISWFKLKRVEKPKHESKFEIQYPKVIPV